jgi:hypothetical protein
MGRGVGDGITGGLVAVGAGVFVARAGVFVARTGKDVAVGRGVAVFTETGVVAGAAV